ncbi:4Fe-4S ferredoxin [Geoglobus acetivorans]|uniref:4Fe-4S ferredoxin n=2 Tax=Geoglobus acetivorans TaxID=565033 RepID=A0A0A7GHH4_GEOAI|nr:4Fe-4S ferredoxin [Geoglobus acetivorans]
MSGGIEITFCRQCKNALADLKIIEAEIEETAKRADWKVRKSHEKIKAGISACPNACAAPQIKDFGALAFIIPEVDRKRCTACGMCVQACRENAIELEEYPVFSEKCIGCGDCMRACPSEAISGQVKFRILAGGKLGRHPRFAEEVLIADDTNSIADVFSQIVKISMENKMRFSHIPGCVDILKKRIRG